jgi:galactokinase
LNEVTAFAPGRVNLIGDHTDHTGGLVLPMAIQLGTTVVGERGGPADLIRLRSDSEAGDALVPLRPGPAASYDPAWARYVAGVVHQVQPAVGLRGRVRTTLPSGVGLSSSAALEVAVALALGFEGAPLQLASACQRAEQAATGVPSGIMDQLCSAAGVEGHALLIDCYSLEVQPVPVPEQARIVVVDSGQTRTLVGSPYAERVAQVTAAEAVVGPLRLARPEHLDAIDDELVRRRARHVVTENDRVREAAAALARGDLFTVGEAMAASHASLRDDFEVSTGALDDLVDRLLDTPGVWGARLTGAGFGGCAVALCDPTADVEGWWVQPGQGAHVSFT